MSEHPASRNQKSESSCEVTTVELSNLIKVAVRRILVQWCQTWCHFCKFDASKLGVFRKGGEHLAQIWNGSRTRVCAGGDAR
eukprot:m.141559 g.141559  ORF g.141559 m.141559 type:complete len:82 (-) comp22866_c0_seq1:197-442(-)